MPGFGTRHIVFTVEFALAKPEVITLSVYDLVGRGVSRLRGPDPTGPETQQITAEVSDLAGGLYVWTLAGGASFAASGVVAIVR
ncbi:MAG: hypothetical protein ACI80V_000082 [Rhodothermales bacterium]